MSKVKLIADRSGFPVNGAFNPISTVKISFTAAAARNTTAFGAEIVRLISTQDCYVKFGGHTVAASANDMLLKANQPEYFSLREGFISAIQVSVGGDLLVTVMC